MSIYSNGSFEVIDDDLFDDCYCLKEMKIYKEENDVNVQHEQNVLKSML